MISFYKYLIAIALTMVFFACIKANTNSNVKILSPADFKKAVESDSCALLLDVRTPEEFSEGHIKGAILLNWKDNTQFKNGIEKLSKKCTIYLYCRSGRRSNAAANYMQSQGFDVRDMQGGIMAWKDCGFETVE